MSKLYSEVRLTRRASLNGEWDSHEIDLVVSECLNDSNFWKMLKQNINIKCSLNMESDEIDNMAHQVEGVIANEIITMLWKKYYQHNE